MNSEEKLLARLLFTVKIHRSTGYAFEQLFAQVMQYSRPNYLRIRPYGNEGDRGNDGYEKEHGRYFQIYSPLEPSKVSTVRNAVNKLKEDFKDKLLPYWHKLCEVKEYYFVFNDKYDGVPACVEEALLGLSIEHKLRCSRVYLAKDLEDELFALQEDKISFIAGSFPEIESNTVLDYRILKEVLDHIQNTPPNLNRKENIVVPDIEDKIRFNGLTYCGLYLKAKQLEVWQLDDYFSRNSEFTKQALRESLAGYYAESLENFPEKTDHIGRNIGDLRFLYILDKIAPSINKPAVDRLRFDAGLVIMAKYFETCDIFEKPLYASN